MSWDICEAGYTRVILQLFKEGAREFHFFAFLTSKSCYTSILHSNDPWKVLKWALAYSLSKWYTKIFFTFFHFGGKITWVKIGNSASVTISPYVFHSFFSLFPFLLSILGFPQNGKKWKHFFYIILKENWLMLILRPSRGYLSVK